MTNDFLRAQLRLLLAQFSRRAVLDALAGITDISSEQLERDIAQLQVSRSSRVPKRNKSVDELLAPLSLGAERKDLILKIARQFEARLFLPNLRDAEIFFERHGVTGKKKHRNRKEVLPGLLKLLAEMPEGDLHSLASHSVNVGGKGDYAILADQLMGKKDTP